MQLLLKLQHLRTFVPGKEGSSATPTLAAVQSFCEESGLDKLVVLLNARVDLLPPW